MKNAAQSTKEIQVSFAIEQTVFDLIDNGAPLEAITKMMDEGHPKFIERVQYYMNLHASLIEFCTPK